MKINNQSIIKPNKNLKLHLLTSNLTNYKNKTKLKTINKNLNKNLINSKSKTKTNKIKKQVK